MRTSNYFIGIIVLLLILGGVFWYFKYQNLGTEVQNKNNQNTYMNISETKDPGATLETSKGIIKIEFFKDEAPKTVENFITLAEKGYYNGLIFHRVIKGFMIQGGDPFCGSKDKDSLCGSGGPGYKFADELNPVAKSYQEGYKKGTVAMANSGPDTNGSQFFIMLQDTPLPKNYTIFGRVISGQSLVDAIGDTATNAKDRPLEPVFINKVTTEK